MSTKKKGKKSSLHLTDKKHPMFAIIATLLALLSVIVFLAACFWSAESHGKAGIFVGLVGVLSFLLSIIGFVLSWISLHQDNIRPLFPTIASVFNGLLVIFYLLLYILGTFL